MSLYEASRITLYILICSGIIALGLNIHMRKRPVVIPGRAVGALLYIPLLMQFTRLPQIIRQASPAALALTSFIIIVTLALVIRQMDEFFFFNVSEGIFHDCLKQVFDKHNMHFEKGPTKGLYAPGVESDSRSIATLYFTGTKAALRYTLDKKIMSGSVRFINKRDMTDYPLVLRNMVAYLRSREQEPGLSPLYYIGFGVFILTILFINR